MDACSHIELFIMYVTLNNMLPLDIFDASLSSLASASFIDGNVVVVLVVVSL